MMNVMVCAGATATSRRMSAAIRPACSAMPTPTIATRMTPTTPNPLKLLTAEVNRKRMPSGESSDSTLIVSVVISMSS